MRKSEADALVATIRAAYPNQEMPEATANLLVAHMRGLDPDVGAAAVDKVISESMFLPSIAELTKAEDAVAEAREESRADEKDIRYLMNLKPGVSRGAAHDWLRERAKLFRELSEKEHDPAFDMSEWIDRLDGLGVVLYRDLVAP